MTTEMEDEAEQYFSECHPELYPGILQWKLRDDNEAVFPKRMLTIDMNPSNFWSIIEKRNCKSGEAMLPAGFADHLRKLHFCPASSGGIERIFSAFGLVWSAVRNRLGAEKAQKLVRVYRFYKNT